LDKLKLPDVTLIAVSSIKVFETALALQKSYKEVEFNKIKLITDQKFENSDMIEVIECDKIDSINKYNEFIFLHLWEYVDTEFALVQQYDSWILNKNCWNDDWYNYSYLGAPWPLVKGSYEANNGEIARVGNGGFSLRDRIVLDTPYKKGWQLRQEQSYFSEDGNINCYYRKEFLKEGIRYAPVEVAAHFSFESEVNENKNIQNFFGFHKNWRKEWLTN
jgi:hypothetical protein